MGKPLLLFIMIGVVALAGPAVAANTASTGFSTDTVVIDKPNPDDNCPGAVFKTNDDGSYENG